MTPLKTPIVLTIETAEEALCVWHRLNSGSGKEEYFKGSPELVPTIGTYNESYLLWQKIDAALKQAGISVTEPLPQPLTIGTHKVEPQPDGSIKVGCTTVTRDTLLQVLALSDAEVRKEAGSEWPKWWRCDAGSNLFTAASDKDLGTWIEVKTGTKTESVCNPAAVRHAANARYIPITPAEAEAILKTTNK